ERGTAPVGAAVGAWHIDRAVLALRRADDFGRRVDRAVVVLVDDLFRCGFQLRGVVEEIFFCNTLLIERGRLAGNRLGRRVPLAGNFTLGHRTLFDREDRLTVRAIEYERICLLRHLRERLDRTTSDADVCKNRRGREVVVPEAVMQRLEMP